MNLGLALTFEAVDYSEQLAPSVDTYDRDADAKVFENRRGVARWIWRRFLEVREVRPS